MQVSVGVHIDPDDITARIDSVRFSRDERRIVSLYPEHTTGPLQNSPSLIPRSEATRICFSQYADFA